MHCLRDNEDALYFSWEDQAHVWCRELAKCILHSAFASWCRYGVGVVGFLGRGDPVVDRLYWRGNRRNHHPHSFWKCVCPAYATCHHIRKVVENCLNASREIMAMSVEVYVSSVACTILIRVTLVQRSAECLQD